MGSFVQQSFPQAGFCWLQPCGIMYHVLLALYSLCVVGQIQGYIIWLAFGLTYSGFFIVLCMSIRRHVMSGFLCFFASWLMPRSIHSLGVAEVCGLFFLQNFWNASLQRNFPHQLFDYPEAQSKWEKMGYMLEISLFLGSFQDSGLIS